MGDGTWGVTVGLLSDRAQYDADRHQASPRGLYVGWKALPAGGGRFSLKSATFWMADEPLAENPLADVVDEGELRVVVGREGYGRLRERGFKNPFLAIPEVNLTYGVLSEEEVTPQQAPSPVVARINRFLARAGRFDYGFEPTYEGGPDRLTAILKVLLVPSSDPRLRGGAVSHEVIVEAGNGVSRTLEGTIAILLDEQLGDEPVALLEAIANELGRIAAARSSADWTHGPPAYASRVTALREKILRLLRALAKRPKRDQGFTETAFAGATAVVGVLLLRLVTDPPVELLADLPALLPFILPLVAVAAAGLAAKGGGKRRKPSLATPARRRIWMAA
jgi:hypothetical protein